MIFASIKRRDRNQTSTISFVFELLNNTSVPTKAEHEKVLFPANLYYL